MKYDIIILCLKVVMSMMPQTKNSELQEALEDTRDSLNRLRTLIQ